MSAESMEERFVRLEVKAAYLEKAALDLEEVVLQQGRVIDELRERLVRLERQAQVAEEGEQLPHEKPPHY